jgi:hypothetical protein
MSKKGRAELLQRRLFATLRKEVLTTDERRKNLRTLRLASLLCLRFPLLHPQGLLRGTPATKALRILESLAFSDLPYENTNDFDETGMFLMVQ